MLLYINTPWYGLGLVQDVVIERWPNNCLKRRHQSTSRSHQILKQLFLLVGWKYVLNMVTYAYNRHHKWRTQAAWTNNVYKNLVITWQISVIACLCPRLPPPLLLLQHQLLPAALGPVRGHQVWLSPPPGQVCHRVHQESKRRGFWLHSLDWVSRWLVSEYSRD